MIVRALLAIGSAPLRRRIERLLRPHGVVVTTASGSLGLRDRLRREDVDLVVATRATLPENLADFVHDLRALPEQPEVVVVEEKLDSASQASALAAGCLAVVYHELSDAALGEALATLARRCGETVVGRLSRERTESRSSLSDFVSASPIMQRFLTMIPRVLRTDSSLLILGETGVGKERLARAIHTEGPRADGPFVAVNTGALPESLLESELFGHEQGAFTGASRARRGYFELAHRGTIFLDEIGEIPQHLQVRFLRVLEDHRIQRVGGERTVDVDVRVIAATNRDLEAEVTSGRFRADLFYRLAVVTLTLPPLRERREDIPDLVRSYLDYFKTRLGCQASSIRPEALDALVAYSWPGNVRELINVIEQVLLLASGTEVHVHDLPRRIIEAAGARAVPVPVDRRGAIEGGSLRQARHAAVLAFEQRYLSELLSSTRGKVGEAASRAGVSSRQLHQLMKRHGLRKESFRGALSGP